MVDMNVPRILFALSLGAALSSGCTAEVEFLDLRVEDITTSGAVVRFDTSVPTTCEVEYGTTGFNLLAEDPAMVGDELSTEHEVPLFDLAADTSYVFRARAEDEDEVVWLSEEGRFDTRPDDGEELTDVATLQMGASVTEVSSNFGGAADDEGWGANHAIDGLVATEWSSHGDGDGAWVEIDLGQERTFTEIGFRSRWMDDGSAIIEGVRLVLDGGTTILGPFETPDPMVTYRFELAAPATARRVRVEATSTTGGNTGAREIQLLAALEE